MDPFYSADPFYRDPFFTTTTWPSAVPPSTLGGRYGGALSGWRGGERGGEFRRGYGAAGDYGRQQQQALPSISGQQAMIPPATGTTALPGYPADSDWLPDLDTYETDSGIIIQVEVPGIPKDSLSIEMRDNNELTIRGERTLESEKELAESDNIRLREREFGKFRRRVRVPMGLDTEKIAAKCDKGVLEVRIPKLGAEGATHRISIE